MSPSNLIRWSALAILVGGILLLTRDILDFVFIPGGLPMSGRVTSDIWLVVGPLTVVGFMLLVPGVIGLYLHQSREVGVLGLVAFLVAFFGSLLYFAGLWSGFLYAPELAQSAPNVLDNPSGRLVALAFAIPFLLFYGGWLLFGFASVRAKVFPRWAGVLLMLGLPLIILQSLVPLVGDVVFAAGLVWMGYALWSRQTRPVPVQAAAVD